MYQTDVVKSDRHSELLTDTKVPTFSFAKPTMSKLKSWSFVTTSETLATSERSSDNCDWKDRASADVTSVRF